MGKDDYNFSRLKLYDTMIFPKMKHEVFLKNNHLKFLDLDLVPFENYIKFTEKYLDNAAEDFQKKHADSLNDQNGNWKLSEVYAKRMMEVDAEFAQRFRESIIIQLYSFFERAIVGSCEMYYLNKEIDDSELGVLHEKSGYEDARLFLKNHANIILNDLNPELDFFSKLTTLRNRIVHHQTKNFYEDEKKINDIRAISKNRFSILIKEDIQPCYFIIFDKPEFSLEIIDKIKSLYCKLGIKGVYY